MNDYTFCADLLATVLLNGDAEISDVCAALHTELQAGRLRAKGYRVIILDGQDVPDEILPDFQLRDMPRRFWKEIPPVDDKGRGHQVDDPDKPIEWQSADWYEGVFAVRQWVWSEAQLPLVKYFGVRLHTQQALQTLSQFNERLGRASPRKGNELPSDEIILAKADEMRARGLDGRAIARLMCHEPGFENCGNVFVRNLILGRYERGQRRLLPERS